MITFPQWINLSLVNSPPTVLIEKVNDPHYYGEDYYDEKLISIDLYSLKSRNYNDQERKNAASEIRSLCAKYKINPIEAEIDLVMIFDEYHLNSVKDYLNWLE